MMLVDAIAGAFNKVYTECARISAHIADALALALDQPALSLHQKGGGGGSGQRAERGNIGGETISLLRIFRYLPYDLDPAAAHQINEGNEVPRAEYIGSSPHTDWGFLTLVLQEERTAFQGAFIMRYAAGPGPRSSLCLCFSLRLYFPECVH